MMTADQVRGRMLRLATAPTRPRCLTVLHGDIVGSTRLAEVAGADYPRLLVRHRRLIAAAVRRAGGRFLAHAGDGSMAVFDRTTDALVAAVEAQRALAAGRWPAGREVRVRMGVHRGVVHEIDGEPVGVAIHHGARVMASAEAGQVLVSDAAAADLPADPAPGRPIDLTANVPRGRAPRVVLADAGFHALRDHDGPVRLHQVVADGLTVVLPRGGDARRRPAVVALEQSAS